MTLNDLVYEQKLFSVNTRMGPTGARCAQIIVGLAYIDIIDL